MVRYFKMNIELVLDSFLNTILDDTNLEIEGEDHPIPTVAKAELGYQFNDSLKKKISPQEFEQKLENVLIEINNPLDEKEKTHYILLYYICYLNTNNPTKLEGLAELNLKKLEKLFENDEKSILKIYEAVKMRALN
jgi:hypothetical protein